MSGAPGVLPTSVTIAEQNRSATVCRLAVWLYPDRTVVNVERSQTLKLSTVYVCKP